MDDRIHLFSDTPSSTDVNVLGVTVNTSMVELEKRVAYSHRVLKEYKVNSQTRSMTVEKKKLALRAGLFAEEKRRADVQGEKNVLKSTKDDLMRIIAYRKERNSKQKVDDLLSKDPEYSLGGFYVPSLMI